MDSNRKMTAVIGTAAVVVKIRGTRDSTTPQTVDNASGAITACAVNLTESTCVQHVGSEDARLDNLKESYDEAT